MPAELRFSGDGVHVGRDERTGDAILSAPPVGRWADFVAARDHLGAAPDDFLADREQPRDPCGDPRPRSSSG